MIGSIIGDIVGSVYEFDNIKTKDFEFFSPNCSYTDDSILTIATADWLLHGGDVANYYSRYGNTYRDPMGGYGSGFAGWLQRTANARDFRSYNSYGNGSAMRVGPVGWAYNTAAEVLAKARESAECTHNHPEGIKGAQATALAIFMARTGSSKDDISNAIEELGYNLDFTCDSIRAIYNWEGSSQGTVPQAIVAFLDGKNFEDCIRNAVSIGGDSDTMACIAGSIAEAFYGVPSNMRMYALRHLPDDLRKVVIEFESTSGRKVAHEAVPSIRNTRRVTPGRITSLKPGQIFVFGSNVHGMHAGGAAAAAVSHFGAVWGQGEGLQGSSYAIPTMEGMENMCEAVRRFTQFAATHPQLHFLVTPIGCGIAGYSAHQVAPLFADCTTLPNVSLPHPFWVILNAKKQRADEFDDDLPF